MNHHTGLVITLLAVFLAFPTLSRAAEDAYFCTYKGYFAYETRKGDTPSVIGHVLRVVRIEPRRGIYLAGEVALPEFAVYHLICSEDRIEISGWRKVFTKYVIEIAKSGEIRSLGPTDYPGLPWSVAAKDGPAPADLGIFGPRVPPLTLESLDPEHEYQLLRNLSGRQVKEGWERHITSELVQLDPKGTVLQRFVLYESRTVESGE
jgi:hypothetical protein